MKATDTVGIVLEALTGVDCEGNVVTVALALVALALVALALVAAEVVVVDGALMGGFTPYKMSAFEAQPEKCLGCENNNYNNCDNNDAH